MAGSAARPKHNKKLKTNKKLKNMETKKTMIVVKGNQNTGKTSSIIQVYEILTSPEVGCTRVTDVGVDPAEDHAISGELFLGLEYKGGRIGINTAGDPDPELPVRLRCLAEGNCDIILTASRTEGVTVRETVAAAKKYDYNIIRTANYSTESDEPGERDLLNSAFARAMVNLIRRLIARPAPASVR
jgi:hypothetical protein